LDQISKHYNQNCWVGFIMRLTRSLETKWGMIKHNIVKFMGILELSKHYKIIK
jgi:hypothetical protein